MVMGKRKSRAVAVNHPPIPAHEMTVPWPGAISQDGGGEDARLQQQLAAARSEMKFMSATIQEQRAEIESERKASDDLNSRLTEAEKARAATQSERAQRDTRIAQLEPETKTS